MALEEQGEGLRDLAGVAAHRGVGERCGFTAVRPGDGERDHITRVEGALKQQLTDLGDAGVRGNGVDAEGNPGVDPVEQKGGGGAGIGARLKEGFSSGADGLGGVEGGDQLLHGLLLNLTLGAAEAGQAVREGLGVAAAGAVQQVEGEGVAVAVGAAELQGRALGKGCDGKGSGAWIGLKGEPCGGAQFTAEQVNSTDSEIGEHDPIVVDNVVGIGGKGEVASAVGIDSFLDQIVVDAGDHTTDREAVLARFSIILNRVVNDLPLGEAVVDINLVGGDEDLGVGNINRLIGAAVELQGS